MDETLFEQLVKLRNKLSDAETNNVDLLKANLEEGPEILGDISNLITKVTQAMEAVRDSETTIDSEEEHYSATACSACGREYCVCGGLNSSEEED